MLSAEQQPEMGAASRVMATALLGSGGAVLLRAQDLDLDHATGDAMQRSVFNWYRQWSGLHRGNATMRSGEDILLDHDAEGALVWVRQLRSATPIVAICNVTGKPLRILLLNDMQKLHLRGSFLRTVARSDEDMGAMPLREIKLPAFGVYVGELSR
jgi:alpha-glucosidase